MRSCKMPCLVIRKSLRICRKKTDRWSLQKRKERQKRRKKRKQNQKRKTTERARKQSRNKQQIYQKTEEISREKEDSVPDFPEETDLADVRRSDNPDVLYGRDFESESLAIEQIHGRDG